ncbi:MAG: hypothetical protein R2939_06855 [Kofleriaceae bacterium]
MVATNGSSFRDVRWTRLAVIACAIALALGAVPLQVALALGGDEVAHCCCGPHDADDDCGCPDCPGGDHGDHHERGPDPAEGPRWNGCGLTGDVAVLKAHLLDLPRPVARLVAPASAQPVPARPSPPASDPPHAQPPTPPPRR